MPRLVLLTGVVVGLGMWAVGCQGNRERATVPNPVALAVPADQAEEEVKVTTQPAALDGLTVDAMVGQVNGKPVYANEVMEAVGREQLQRLGEALPRPDFRERARSLIESHLRQVISDALILAEAERGLSEQEQMGLTAYIQQRRAELIRQYGGFPTGADVRLRERTGQGLEETLTGQRQKLLVERYLREKLFPRIDVSRRNVEQYYADHPEEFNPEPSVTVRVIVVEDEAAADQVEAALAAGQPFHEVARQYSTVRKEDGGLLPTFQNVRQSQFKALKWEPLNEQVRSLAAGEHSGQTAIRDSYGWVKVEEAVKAEEKPLKDVYLDIEKKLRLMKFNQLSRQYLEKLLAEGNFTPVDQMVNALVEVAMSRHARPQ